MSRIGQMVMNVLIQQEAVETAIEGSAVGVAIVGVYLALLVVSIIGLAVVIERMVRLKRRRLMDDDMAADLVAAFRNGDMERASALCGTGRTVMARAFAEELDEHREGRIPIEEAVETAGRIIERRLTANLDILSTVAKIGPLLGLLGTVLGMVYAFRQLDVAARKETLAQGIVTALDTTVRGLIIAIGAIVMERHFYRRIDALTEGLDAIFTRIVRGTRNIEKGFERAEI